MLPCEIACFVYSYITEFISLQNCVNISKISGCCRKSYNFYIRFNFYHSRTAELSA